MYSNGPGPAEVIVVESYGDSGSWNTLRSSSTEYAIGTEQRRGVNSGTGMEITGVNGTDTTDARGWNAGDCSTDMWDRDGTKIADWEVDGTKLRDAEGAWGGTTHTRSLACHFDAKVTVPLWDQASVATVLGCKISPEAEQFGKTTLFFETFIRDLPLDSSMTHSFLAGSFLSGLKNFEVEDVVDGAWGATYPMLT